MLSPPQLLHQAAAPRTELPRSPLPELLGDSVFTVLEHCLRAPSPQASTSLTEAGGWVGTQEWRALRELVVSWEAE